MTKSIPLTKGKFAIVDDEDFEYLNQWKWYAQDDGGTFYAARYGLNREHVMMHRLIMNTPKGMKTDHINGDGLDNRKENLRICTNAQNGRNRKLNQNNQSGYKGVCWHKRDKKWDATIKLDFKTIHLGSFDTPEEAARAYDVAAKQYFGEFAKLNLE